MSIQEHHAALKELTSANNSGAAYFLCCLIIGDRADRLGEIFENINKLHTLEGCLPAHLEGYRREKYQAMLRLAEEVLSTEDYELMYKCL